MDDFACRATQRTKSSPLQTYPIFFEKHVTTDQPMRSPPATRSRSLRKLSNMEAILNSIKKASRNRIEFQEFLGETTSAISTDGKILAYGLKYENGTITLWDQLTERPIRTLHMNFMNRQFSVRELRFTPNNKILFAKGYRWYRSWRHTGWSRYCNISAWDVPTGVRILEYSAERYSLVNSMWKDGSFDMMVDRCLNLGVVATILENPFGTVTRASNEPIRPWAGKSSLTFTLAFGGGLLRRWIRHPSEMPGNVLDVSRRIKKKSTNTRNSSIEDDLVARDKVDGGATTYEGENDPVTRDEDGWPVTDPETGMAQWSGTEMRRTRQFREV
ncbi:hypothetical protein TWF481_004842 [Arthrobotrys musiformis]|uniref:Uncharacterized protein n=1 Tax=Arthrobotrys musiformis TaxID=47236 RepID=A0AAV9WKY7_9PEZI